MMARSLAILLLASIVLSGATPAVAQAPAGQMTWAVHVSLAPTWFDPAEHTGIITLMMVLYAVHDALVKPMPGNPLAPSLAESWSMSKDGLSYYVQDGLYSWGGYPDMDDLFVQQARELDPKRREVLLHQIQRLAHERVMSAPLWELGFLNAVGPRVDESGLGLIALFPYSSPYEDLKLKK